MNAYDAARDARNRLTGIALSVRERLRTVRFAPLILVAACFAITDTRSRMRLLVMSAKLVDLQFPAARSAMVDEGDASSGTEIFCFSYVQTLSDSVLEVFCDTR